MSAIELPERTLLHRMLGIAMGRAPRWLCSGNSCDGFDLLVAIDTALLVASWFAFRFHWSAGLMAACFFVGYTAMLMSFERVERKARAILRRAAIGK